MALQEEFEQQGKWLFRYRGILPLIILGIGIVIYALTKIYPRRFFLEETPYEHYYEIACLLVGFFGLAIRIYTIGYAPKNTSGRRVKSLNADVLNTTGIYSLVRHPLYVGNFVMWLSPTLLTGNLWFIIAFILFYWVYYERIMFAEEQFLRKKYGDTYLNWANNVPAFIPNFKNFVKPSITFNWNKVLQKERNGLAALFIIFLAFNLLGVWIQDNNDYNYIIIWGCIISCVSFAILKLLEKQTSILDY